MSDQPDGPTELRDARDRAIESRDQAQAELREFKAGVFFKDAGLESKHAELFLKTNPDVEVTEQAALAFAEEYNLQPAVAPEPAPTEPAPAPDSGPAVPADAGLGALSEAAGSGTSGDLPAAQPKMSKEAFEKLLATNPQAAAEAYTKGLVDRNSLNVQADQLVQKGIIDH
jgi:hypothetical protein